MSMAGGDAAMQLDFTVNTTQLDRALSEADRRITAATRGTGNTIDRLMEKVSQGVGAKLAGAITSGLAINVIDKALRKVADGIRESQSAEAIGMAIADSIVEAIRAIPVAGALTDIVAQIADPLMGGAMERNRAAEGYQAFQRMQMDGLEKLRQLRLKGASLEEQEQAERIQRIKEIEALEIAAIEAKTYKVEEFNQADYDAAVETAKKKAETDFAMMRATSGPGVAGTPAIVMPDRALYTRTVTKELEEGARTQISAARDAALKALDEEFAQRARDRAAKESERLARDAEKAAAEQERRLKAQEEAYDRFVEGNTQEAILALEAQLQAAGTAAAPTRADRLAQLMAGMTGGIGTADTALGAFTFATGDPAQISRDILENAKSQLAALERIEAIQREIAALQKGTGFN